MKTKKIIIRMTKMITITTRTTIIKTIIKKEKTITNHPIPKFKIFKSK